MSKMNRLANVHNKYQGKFKKVLCVCSAGLLRSPTAALVLSESPFYYNTRAAGLSEEYALIVVDDVLLEWADEIVCMEQSQKYKLMDMTDKPIICLEIPDEYAYRNISLMEIIPQRYLDIEKEKQNE